MTIFCIIYLKTSLGGLFELFPKTTSISLFPYSLQRKQFVCFELYFSFIEYAAQKGHRGKFLDMITAPLVKHSEDIQKSFGLIDERTNSILRFELPTSSFKNNDDRKLNKSNLIFWIP